MLTALDEHLWTGGSAAPVEYLELVLWKYAYECTPLELEAIVERYGLPRVLRDLEMLNVEAENRRLKMEIRYGR